MSDMWSNPTAQNHIIEQASTITTLRARVAELEGDVRCSEAAGKDLDRRLTAMQQERDALQATNHALRAALKEARYCCYPHTRYKIDEALAALARPAGERLLSAAKEMRASVVCDPEAHGLPAQPAESGGTSEETITALRAALEANVKLVETAQGIIGEYLPTDGIPSLDAMAKLIETFDGPEQRKAKALAEAALTIRTNSGT